MTNLHDDLTDSIALKFFKDHEDLSLQILIDWQDDLGIRVMMMSDGERAFARSGSAESITDALNKLIQKAIPKIQEDRERQAKIEAAFEDQIGEIDD